MHPSLGEAGSPVSLSSSAAAGGGGATRDTSDTASAVTTRITANTIAATAAVLATDPRVADPGREGPTTTTLLSLPHAMARCKVGLQSSCMGVGAILSPINIGPLLNIKIEKKQRKAF